MALRNTPIRKKLMTMMLLTSGVVLLLTCAAFLAYEFLTFRRSAVSQLATLGEIVATNSTAALAFENQDDARQVLSALRAEPHILATTLYDAAGRPFASYPENLSLDSIPRAPGEDGYRFDHGHLTGFEPVVENDRRLGTLYLHMDMGALADRLQLYGFISVLVFAVSLLLAYLLARKLQQQISQPILVLADVANAVSDRKDYSVRAPGTGRDEVGRLTEAFNQMLAQIQVQNEALSESEGQNRAIVDSALDGVVAMNHEGVITGFNPAAERIFGYTGGDVIGRPLADVLIPPDLREAHRQGLARYLATGENQVIGKRIELTGLRADGTIVSIELSITRMPGAGAPMFTGFLRDITERKQADEKLLAQLARIDLLNRITRAIGERQDLESIFEVVLRNLEENLPIDFGCICLHDPVENVLTVAGLGPASRKLAGDLGLTLQTQIPVDQNGLARCIQGHLVYEPDISTAQSPFTRNLADRKYRSLTAAPLLLESRVFGVLIAARLDSHAFTSLDCEFLRQLSEHAALAAHQAQIYAALQQAYDDLRQSQQTVLQQERLRALGEMASGIAHDINNAISPVMLYTQALLEGETNLSATAREYLETIERAIEDVAGTVSRMREFYRPRQPQLTLAPTNLNALVQQVLHLTRARWSDMPQQRGAVIENSLELAPDLPDIMGAEGEIRDGLTNLIFNGVDAMPRGGKLTVRTYATTAAEAAASGVPRQVVIEVRDTGVGMDESTRQRCLEPFFTTKGERGTGLGLAMVYGMVQRHSADIGIESVLGQGTTVRLSFALPVDIRAEAGTSKGAAGPAPLRILVVDDDPLLLRSLRDTLTSDGHTVVTTPGGREGITAFKAAAASAEPFSVVITDLGMPHVDGREVARTIKETSSSTPVIMLTGWGQRLLSDGDIPPHVDRLMSKPPKLRDLREALVYCVQLSSS